MIKHRLLYQEEVGSVVSVTALLAVDMKRKETTVVLGNSLLQNSDWQL